MRCLLEYIMTFICLRKNSIINPNRNIITASDDNRNINKLKFPNSQDLHFLARSRLDKQNG